MNSCGMIDRRRTGTARHFHTANGSPIPVVQRLMHHPHRYQPVVRPWLFDAQILEMLGEIRRAGRGEELGDGELEGVGEFL